MKRIVLKDTVTPQDFRTLAARYSWVWWNELQQTRDQPFEKIWVTDDAQNSIHYLEDFVSGLRYVLVRGVDNSEITQIIRSRVATYSDDEIKSLVYQAQTTEEDT